MQTKTLTIQLNDELLPILLVDPGAYLTFSIHNSGNALEQGTFDQKVFYEAFGIFDNQSIEKSLVSENPPDWDLPAGTVQSGLETLLSHLGLVQGGTALLYEMT